MDTSCIHTVVCRGAGVTETILDETTEVTCSEESFDKVWTDSMVTSCDVDSAKPVKVMFDGE